MIEGSLGLFIEGLVCVLLVATIFYCISVNGKLQKLRNEQKGMRSFIQDLSKATQNADQAIQGLRNTVQASGNELAGQIDKGRVMSRQLKTGIETAQETMNKLLVLTGSAERALSAPTGHVAQPGQAGTGGVGVHGIENLKQSMMGFEDLEGNTNTVQNNAGQDPVIDAQPGLLVNKGVGI